MSQIRANEVRPAVWSLSGALVIAGLILYGRPQGVSGDVVLIVGALLSLAALLSGAKHPQPLLLPWAFVALAAASSMWSASSSTALSYAVALAVPLFIAGQIVANLPFDRFLVIADWTLRAIVVASVIIAVLEPSIGLQERVYDGALRGLYAHKNGMGFIVIIAAVTLLARNWTPRKRSFGSACWLLGYLGVLVWANSAGAIALFLVSLGVYQLTRWFAVHPSKIRGSLSVVAVCFIGAVAVIAAPLAPAIFQLFGKDLTFTGRIYIWEGAIEAWREHFWLGYGWMNILGADDEAAAAIRQTAGYTVRSTHNGYLATALQLGVVGVILSVSLMIWLLSRTWRAAAANPGPQSLWSLQVALILILGDFIETRAFTNLGWFLLCIVAYYGRQAPIQSAKRSTERVEV